MDRFRKGVFLLLYVGVLSVPGFAGADDSLFSEPKMGFEYELEKGARNAWQSSSVTLVPGFHVNSPWLNLVELLLEGAREHVDETGERSIERKVGLRLRRDFPIGENSKFVLRGLLGHAWQGEENYSYYYLEPSFRYSIGPVETMVGYRMVRGIDANKAHDLHKFRIGPSIDLSEDSELEFRWVRAWSLHTGQHFSDAYIVEFTHKF